MLREIVIFSSNAIFFFSLHSDACRDILANSLVIHASIRFMRESMTRETVYYRVHTHEYLYRRVLKNNFIVIILICALRNLFMYKHRLVLLASVFYIPEYVVNRAFMQNFNGEHLCEINLIIAARVLCKRCVCSVFSLCLFVRRYIMHRAN